MQILTLACVLDQGGRSATKGKADGNVCVGTAR